MHRPSICWSLRRDLKDYVLTTRDDEIMMWVNGRMIKCDRLTARLLAKRINQCLDGTTAKAVRRAAQDH